MTEREREGPLLDVDRLDAPIGQLADDPLRHFGSSDPVLAEHLLTCLGRLAPLIPVGHRRPIAH